MHTRALAAALLLAGAVALTGCSSNSTEPTPTAAVTTTTPATAPAAAASADDADPLIQKCVDAVQASPDSSDDAPECASLSAADYTKALNQSKQLDRDELQKKIDDAANGNP